MITAVCLTSKFPVENLSLKAVVHALKQIFAKVGYPREIQGDLRICFTGDLNRAFFLKYNIKVSHSSVRHSQRKQVDHLHSMIKQIVKVLCLRAKSGLGRKFAYGTPCF